MDDKKIFNIFVRKLFQLDYLTQYEQFL